MRAYVVLDSHSEQPTWKDAIIKPYKEIGQLTTQLATKEELLLLPFPNHDDFLFSSPSNLLDKFWRRGVGGLVINSRQTFVLA